jgi:peptide/nickel transport system substrate-binding protein
MKKVVFLLVVFMAFWSIAHAQTLVFGQSALPISLDTANDGNSLAVSYQIVENLVGFKQSSAEIDPLLAVSWEASEDASSWTFKLREGVNFSDGTPLNAEAVKFNFDRWNNQDNPYAFAAEGKDFSAWPSIFGNFYGQEGYLIESVEVVDDLTVTFNLTRPVGFLPQLLAASYFGMHSPQAVMAGGLEYGSPVRGAVGTGAFMFVEWIDGDRLTLARNEAYWGEKAKVERIVFRGIQEAATRLAELEAGSLDIVIDLSPDDYGAVSNNPDLKVVFPEADLRIGYIGMHQANEPFDDVRVRQAIAYAIDKDAIVEAFYGELGAVANEFIPPTLIGRLDNEPYPYDPEKAKALLAEAGYPDGFETQFWYMPVSRPYYPNPKDVAEAAASMLADVGIRAELMTEDWGIYLEDFRQGKFPIYMLGWSADFADSDNFIAPFFNSSQAVAGFGWNNPEVFAMIEAAQSAGSTEERIDLYQKIGQFIYDEMPALPVVNPRSLSATRANIEGFYPNPLGSVVPFSTITKN